MNPWDKDARRIEAELSAESPSLDYRRLSDIVSKAVDWLWRPWLAKGKVSMIAGNPGLGKSQATLGIAAAVSTGGRLPDGTRCERGRVIIVSAEDDPADTVRPRLEAAGANLENIYIIDAVNDGYLPDGTRAQRGFSLAEDLSKLAKMTADIGEVALIVFDPITAYLGSTDSHKNAEVRAMLAPLSKVAEQCGAAIVCVSHLNKAGGSDALMRVTGSLAFVAAARAAYVVLKDPADEDRRLFLPLKNNLGSDQTGLAFRVESASVSGIETSRVVWEAGAVTITATEAMRAASGDSGERSAVSDATEWLTELLESGSMRTKDVEAEAKGAGLSWRTVRRAKDSLGVKAVKDGINGGWLWRLPEGGHEGVQGKNLAIFEDGQHSSKASNGLAPGHLGHLEVEL